MESLVNDLRGLRSELKRIEALVAHKFKHEGQSASKARKPKEDFIKKLGGYDPKAKRFKRIKWHQALAAMLR